MPSEYRHEWKHEINYADALVIRQRLRAVMSADPNADAEYRYLIRSLYFDDMRDTALWEKLDGVNRREKFRIRLYNHNADFIRLEKKSKWNGLTKKDSAMLSLIQTQEIISGNINWMSCSEQALVRELGAKMRNRGLRPKTIVDYIREAYIYPAGNVRVTLDSQIRSGVTVRDFWLPDCVTVPIDSPVILEVKWESFLPDIIRKIVQLPCRQATAFSKYALCRTIGY